MTDKAIKAVDVALEKSEFYRSGLSNEYGKGFGETIQFALSHLKMCMAEDWQPMDTAPKDGRTIILYHLDSVMPMYYSAWWMEREDPIEWSLDIDIDGHFWVLNDDADQLIEEDTDLSNWYWKPLEQPSEKSLKEFMEGI